MADRQALQEQQIQMAEELLFSGPRTTSFAKLLYFGVFDNRRVLPFPQPAKDEKDRVERLISDFNVFADEHLDPDWIDRNAKIPDEVIAGLGRLGILGLTIPKEYGGLGLTQYAYCRVMEEVSRRCGSTALFVNAHQSIGLKALVLFGTPQQREKYLPALARGEHLAAFSLTEPEAGSDAANVKTRAVFAPQKNVYRITGRKQWTTNGSIAKVLTVMAQTEVQTPAGPKDKITAFIVTPDMPGFKVLDAALEKVGMRGSITSNLAFENMEVPAENILGPIGGGLKVALTVLDYGRTTFGATCTGAAKRLLERAIRYARKRHQFGRPLAAFPLVKKKIATMAALTYAMDATTYLTAGLLDRHEEDFMLETAILKVFASDSLWTIVYETMQIYGGRSLFTDEPFERMMRDARLNMIGEGANEVMRAFIGLVGMRDVGEQLKNVAQAARQPWSHARALLAFGGQTLARILKPPPITLQSPQLAGEARRAARAVRKFGLSVPRLLAKHREAIVDRQLSLDRIATSAIALYTSTSVLSKLDADLHRPDADPELLANDLAAGKLYCQEALATVDRCLASLFKNNDRDIEATSDQLSGLQNE